MKSAFRNARFTLTLTRFLNPKPNATKPFPSSIPHPIPFLSSRSRYSPMAGGDSHAPLNPSSARALEKEFANFRNHLEESGSLREKIRSVVTEIESSTRVIYASLLLVHQSRPVEGGNENRNRVCFGLFN